MAPKAQGEETKLGPPQNLSCTHHLKRACGRMPRASLFLLMPGHCLRFSMRSTALQRGVPGGIGPHPPCGRGAEGAHNHPPDHVATGPISMYLSSSNRSEMPKDTSALKNVNCIC